MNDFSQVAILGPIYTEQKWKRKWKDQRRNGKHLRIFAIWKHAFLMAGVNGPLHIRKKSLFPQFSSFFQFEVSCR